MNPDGVVNKALICFYTFIHTFMYKKKLADSREILVIESGVLGDGILLLSAMHRLEETYNAASGYHITLVCRESMQGFLRENLSNAVRIITIPVTGLWPSFFEFRKVVHTIQGTAFSKCVTLLSHNWGDLFAKCANAHEKAASTVDLYKRRRIARYMLKHTYDILVEYPLGTFLPKGVGLLFKTLGDYGYQPEKYFLTVNANIYPNASEEYVLVAPMARETFRNLSKEQTVAIINYIIKKTDKKVYVTGQPEDRKYIEEIAMECTGGRVVNYAGYTNLKEFMQLISKAAFLIGSDSGHIHLAASLNVPSICLAGEWDKGKYFPYDFDIKSKNDPVCIYGKEKECRYCVYNDGGLGSGNKQCGKKIKAGRSALCLETIDMADVYMVIDRLI